MPSNPCAGAVVIHPLRPAPWYACLRDERKNRYDALLFKRHPDLFRQRIPAYRGLVAQYYASVLGAAAGMPLGCSRGRCRWPWAGLDVWALLEINLIYRRLPSHQPLTATDPAPNHPDRAGYAVFVGLLAAVRCYQVPRFLRVST